MVLVSSALFRCAILKLPDHPRREFVSSHGTLTWFTTPAGHSLGGAVASLCALRLLRLLPQEQHHTVTVVGFASPAFGNAAVAAHVEAAGWADRFTNYLLPGEASFFSVLGFKVHLEDLFVP